MQRMLLLKTILIGALALSLLIPLVMIQGTVSERAQLRNHVVSTLTESAFSQQKLTGPVLFIPYRKTIRNTTLVGEKQIKTVKEEYQNGTLRFLPDSLKIHADTPVETRYRGIYKALQFLADTKLSGEFLLPKNFGVDNPEDYTWGQAILAVGVTDNRGIRGNPSLSWAGEEFSFASGTETDILMNGVHAKLNKLSPATINKYAFNISIKLRGMGLLEFMPIGKQTIVTMASSWPHPSFVGSFLPDSRKVSDAGFSASWQTTHLSTNLNQAFEKCESKSCVGWTGAGLGTSFIQPVDIYQQAERTVKYGFLFIALTFIAFFLFEVIKRLAIHPIQYTLVGVALAMFFLLLISLSEHMRFGTAYAIAASACIVLISFYVTHVLRSKAMAVGFATGLSAIYGALYVLIQAEDYSLLMGSALLFGLLAGLMFITRKIDWYAIGTPSTNQNAA
jgi:inner membrane protein